MPTLSLKGGHNNRVIWWGKEGQFGRVLHTCGKEELILSVFLQSWLCVLFLFFFLFLLFLSHSCFHSSFIMCLSLFSFFLTFSLISVSLKLSFLLLSHLALLFLHFSFFLHLCLVPVLLSVSLSLLSILFYCLHSAAKNDDSRALWAQGASNNKHELAHIAPARYMWLKHGWVRSNISLSCFARVINVFSILVLRVSFDSIWTTFVRRFQHSNKRHNAINVFNSIARNKLAATAAR